MCFRIGAALFVSVLCAHSATPGAEAIANARRLGDVKTVTTLLSAGVSPDTADRYGRTPLYYAAAFNQMKIVSLLLSYHADPNLQKVGHQESAKDPVEAAETPLQYAADWGNVRIAEMLVAAGARVSTATVNGRTALHFAALSRHLDAMRFLLEVGVDPNIRDHTGASPLDDAAWRGNLDEIAVLLAHGAHLNDPEPKTGATPINEAAYAGRTAVVQYLLQFHPDLETPDKRGFTPLENAVRKDDETSALLLLAADNTTQHRPDVFLRTLDAAINKDESDLVKAILQSGVSPDTALSSGSTLLDVAAFVGSTKTAQVLLDEKADPTRIGRNGNSVLEDAALKGFDTIAALLLDHGAAVNRANPSSGETALYTAASFGKVQVAELLLNRGANPNLCGKNQKTPYQVALDNEYPELAAKIKTHGGVRACSK